MAFDPILVEVVKNELAAITEEMAIAVWKTGRSAMVKPEISPPLSVTVGAG